MTGPAFHLGVPAAHLDHKALHHAIEDGAVIMLFLHIAQHIGDAFGRAHGIELQGDVAHRGRDQKLRARSWRDWWAGSGSRRAAASAGGGGSQAAARLASCAKAGAGAATAEARRKPDMIAAHDVILPAATLAQSARETKKPEASLPAFRISCCYSASVQADGVSSFSTAAP